MRRRGEERGGKRGGPRHEKENQGNGKKLLVEVGEEDWKGKWKRTK